MLNAVTSSSLTAVCPSCGQRAPIVLRGMQARCSACGAFRQPFGAQSLTLAGQPSRIGGMAAYVAGAGIVGVVFVIAALVLVLLQSIWPHMLIGWALALPIALISSFVGLLLVFGGRSLRQRGDAKQRAVQLEAMRALLAHR